MLKKPHQLKKPNRKKVKEKAIDAFQMWVRWRDNFTCITCGTKVDPYSETAKMMMHAGHYIGRGNENVVFHEKNVNAQCRNCNGKENWTGDKNPYALKLIEKYGPDILQELENAKTHDHNYSISDLQEIEAKYLNLINEDKNGQI